MDLVEEYYHRTELYDCTVCTGPIGPDGIMPADHAELAAINQHAHQVRRELVDRAVRAGFTEAQFKEPMMHQVRQSPTAAAAQVAPGSAGRLDHGRVRPSQERGK